MKHLDALINRTPALAVCRADLEAAVQTLETMHKAGGKLLLCGNGGSAADCGHISGELLKSFLLPRPVADGRLDAATRAVLQEGVAAIPLPAFSTLISAFANDVNADFVYAQLVYVLGREGDVLLCLSTSGNAKMSCMRHRLPGRAGCRSSACPAGTAERCGHCVTSASASRPRKPTGCRNIICRSITPSAPR